MNTLVYYLNSSSESSSSACFGSSADHGQPCHGMTFLAVPSLGSAEVSVLAVLSLGSAVVSAVVSSRPCRVSIRLFSRFPRKEGQYYTTNSPFTPVGGESTKPVLRRHTTSFSIGKTLVSMSDPFSSVWIFARTNSFSSTLSRNQWYLL